MRVARGSESIKRVAPDPLAPASAFGKAVGGERAVDQALENNSAGASVNTPSVGKTKAQKELDRIARVIAEQSFGPTQLSPEAALEMLENFRERNPEDFQRMMQDFKAHPESLVYVDHSSKGSFVKFGGVEYQIRKLEAEAVKDEHAALEAEAEAAKKSLEANAAAFEAEQAKEKAETPSAEGMVDFAPAAPAPSELAKREHALAISNLEKALALLGIDVDQSQLKALEAEHVRELEQAASLAQKNPTLGQAGLLKALKTHGVEVKPSPAPQVVVDVSGAVSKPSPETEVTNSLTPEEPKPTPSASTIQNDQDAEPEASAPSSDGATIAQAEIENASASVQSNIENSVGELGDALGMDTSKLAEAAAAQVQGVSVSTPRMQAASGVKVSPLESGLSIPGSSLTAAAEMSEVAESALEEKFNAEIDAYAAGPGR